MKSMMTKRSLKEVIKSMMAKRS